jgi:hypothetical protein
MKNKKCEHDWHFKKGWKSDVEFEDCYVRIPVKCSLCKKEAFEIYKQISYEDEYGDEICS